MHAFTKSLDEGAPRRHQSRLGEGCPAQSTVMGRTLLECCCKVRSRSLRSHSGEVSCPGGKADDLDATLLDTALRETREEMGIAHDRIETLGHLGPPEKSLRGDIVWPFVGFVHSESTAERSEDPNAALPSIDLDAIRKTASKDEVDFVFHLPLAQLGNPARHRRYLFRNKRPYTAMDVSDLVEPLGGEFRSTSIERPELDEVDGGRVEVWGLTGWYLWMLASHVTAPVSESPMFYSR
ncbi:Nudix hydrolase domain-containing protein [Mycena chlorophos]|uniref:Nudix hydrolase domain-containing protein n=1 Tax=Mycena chlorophos TaxID=658473 RepID=A0A8H6W7J8_MYCCL|nr:Nudix hydrolase domain-containing protein [Mycena chlorophos]